MFAQSKTQKVTEENIVVSFLKGIIVAMLLSFALVLIFAVILRWLSLSDSVIVPVVMLIKAFCVVIGSLIAIKGKTKGLAKGAVFGLIYIVVSFVLFSILAGSFSVSTTNFLDVVSAIILGGIVGILKVNRKNWIWNSKILCIYSKIKVVESPTIFVFVISGLV